LGSTIKTLFVVDWSGIPYIFPFGAKTPPNHFKTPLPNPVIVVVSTVLVIGFKIATLGDVPGMKYILPFDARTPPCHLPKLLLKPVIVL
jgi:hypothetical protein